MSEKYPYSSDWRVIRGRLLGKDYKQISCFNGCWSERPDWVMIKMNKKRRYNETHDRL